MFHQFGRGMLIL